MIEVAGLRVVLPGAVLAVDGVDLTIQPGEFVVILGRSGAGKTTFLRSINRLIEPTAGTVRVAGRPVTGADPAALRAARRQIGMVFQQFNLVRRAPVLDNVLAGRLGYVPVLPSLLGRFPTRDRDLALGCLAQVGLDHLAGRRADTLSGGEQQRVAIARALAQAPAVILADEPTASLDPALTADIMSILRSINRERGLTLVVSQHQLETARAYATRHLVVVLDEERLVQDGVHVLLVPRREIAERVFHALRRALQALALRVLAELGQQLPDQLRDPAVAHRHAGTPYSNRFFRVSCTTTRTSVRGGSARPSTRQNARASPSPVVTTPSSNGTSSSVR